MGHCTVCLHQASACGRAHAWVRSSQSDMRCIRAGGGGGEAATVCAATRAHANTRYGCRLCAGPATPKGKHCRAHVDQRRGHLVTVTTHLTQECPHQGLPRG